jgi:hypothetical protein
LDFASIAATLLLAFANEKRTIEENIIITVRNMDFFMCVIGFSLIEEQISGNYSS